MALLEFFSKNPVFTSEEVASFLKECGGKKRKTSYSQRSNALLWSHNKKGRILRVRRGLYCSVPEGSDSNKYLPDPYLLASKMANDAVLAYYTALEFYGITNSLLNSFQYLSLKPYRLLHFKSYQFQGLKHPKALIKSQQENLGVIVSKWKGVSVKVTSLERTLVDMLNCFIPTKNFKDIWRSLAAIESINFDELVKYTLSLGNSAAVARVGFFLESQSGKLMPENSHIKLLQKGKPKGKRYLVRRGGPQCVISKNWNLLVPKSMLNDFK